MAPLAVAARTRSMLLYHLDPYTLDEDLASTLKGLEDRSDFASLGPTTLAGDIRA